jgi:SsrA-binding protein
MAKQKAGKEGELLVCRNPKALKNYDIDWRIEAGMVLMGSEVKSLRARKGDLEGAYASIDQGELYLHKMHIAPYEQAGPFGHENKRTRKLLVHRAELEKLVGKLAQRGFTLVPLSVYFKDGRAKVELGLGRGKKTDDQREEIKKKIDMRETRAAMEKTRR